MSDLRLIFVNSLGKNSDGYNSYEFYFTDADLLDIDLVWMDDFEVKPASICDFSVPESSIFHDIKKLNTNITFCLAQKNSCFSMQDCKDGIIPVAFESLDDVDEYPENGRVVFKFGESIYNVELALSKRDISFS